MTVHPSSPAYTGGNDQRVAFFYADDASNPNWSFIDIVTISNAAEDQDVLMSYTIPNGAEKQAIRVQIFYITHLAYTNPCNPGSSYNDSETLTFIRFHAFGRTT